MVAAATRCGAGNEYVHTVGKDEGILFPDDFCDYCLGGTVPGLTAIPWARGSLHGGVDLAQGLVHGSDEIVCRGVFDHRYGFVVAEGCGRSHTVYDFGETCAASGLLGGEVVRSAAVDFHLYNPISGLNGFFEVFF